MTLWIISDVYINFIDECVACIWRCTLYDSSIGYREVGRMRQKNKATMGYGTK